MRLRKKMPQFKPPNGFHSRKVWFGILGFAVLGSSLILLTRASAVYPVIESSQASVSNGATKGSDPTASFIQFNAPEPTSCPVGQTGTPPNCVTPTADITFPLKLSSTDHHHLYDTNGSPVLINGDTAWEIVSEIPKEKAVTYLDDRKAKGINAILVTLMVYKYTTHAPNNYYNQPPFTTTNDFATPNEAYFANVDYVMQAAKDRGMIVLLAPSIIGYGGTATDDGWYNVMVANGATKMFNFGKYVGNRYKNFDNIIWLNGGDWDPPNKTVVDQLALGIKSVDPNNLQTAHGHYNSTAGSYWDTASWLDLDDIYNYNDVYDSARTIYGLNKRPFFMIESSYENAQFPYPGGALVSLAQVRAQAYQPILGGAFGHMFGNCPIFSFDFAPEVCSDKFVPKWESNLNTPGIISMQWLGKLMHSRAWQDLVPDFSHTTLTAGYTSGGFNYDAAARTTNGNTVIAYYTYQKALTFDMTKVSGSSARAWWFNPSNGSTTNLGTFPTTGTKSFTPPSTGDWVLVLDDASLNLSAPGS